MASMQAKKNQNAKKTVPNDLKHIATVDELKKIYGGCSLDFIFGIKDEPDLQCQYIDPMQDTIGEVYEKLLTIIETHKDVKLKSELSPILEKMYQLAHELENRRHEFENLREWGKAWKDLSIKAMNDTKNPENYLDFRQIDI